MSQECFDCRVHLPHVHWVLSLHQGLDHGPLNHAVAEANRPRSLRHGSVPATLIQKTSRKSIENARERWGMV